MSMTVLVRLARNGLGNPNIQFYCLFITPINVRTCTALSFHKNVGVKEMETIYYIFHSDSYLPLGDIETKR